MTRRSLTVGLAVGLALAACGDTKRPQSEPAGPPPETFSVAFETTKGRFVVAVDRKLAPLGADRFYALVTDGFFDEGRFFRVVKGFVAQWGANGDPKRNAEWDAKKIADDSVKGTNTRGTVSFAHDGPGTRSHQVFVNLRDNSRLDKMGFAPIGQVVEGMAVVDSLYSGYGEKPDYHLISTLGNDYLRRMFSQMDYIKTATVVK